MDETVFIDTDDNKGLKLKVFYKEPKIYVEVRFKETIKKGDLFPSFTPYFGLDIVDQQMALKMADEFAAEIDKEYNL